MQQEQTSELVSGGWELTRKAPTTTIIKTAEPYLTLNGNMNNLSRDVFFNIFPRLPLKLLLQLRSVSKLWCSIVDHPLTAHMHLSVSPENKTLSIIAHDPKSDSIKFCFLKEEGRNLLTVNEISSLPISRRCTLEGSCSGLLCFVRYNVVTGDEIFICNPLLKQVTSLTSPPSASFPCRYVLGYCSSTVEYKLLRIEPDTNFQAKIYSMRTKSWKNIPSERNYPVYGEVVYAKGALHWKTKTCGMYDGKAVIVSFDVEKEVFEVINHPQLGYEKMEMIDVVELHGKLCLVDRSSTMHLDIWMLKNNEWVREYRIAQKTGYGLDFKVTGIWDHDEIFFILNDDGYLSCDTKTDTLKYLNITGLLHGFTVKNVFCHEGSLMSVP